MHDCMVRNQNVIAESPRDADGGAVFNAYGPVRSFIGPYDDWFKNYKKGGHEDVFNGSFCCAAYPVSFHYVDAHEQARSSSTPELPSSSHSQPAVAATPSGDRSP